MLKNKALERNIYLVLFCIIFLFYSASVMGQPVWGRLANPGFENEPVKSTFFFTGNSKNDVQYYEEFPGNNLGLYTVHPSDDTNLRWSEDTAYQAFVIDDMISSGINVVNMSIWGTRGTDNWAYWAPMQTSTYSHDELFNIALSRNIVIAPYLESAAESPTGDPEFSFMDDFPGNPANPAPNTVDFIEDLINRYILYPDNPLWQQKWAKAYDQTGTARYMICIIHAASTEPGITDQAFAEGFDRLADTIYNHTGVRIGFTLDILPHHIAIADQFRANPELTGPFLAQQESILGIQCYIPEVFLGMEHEAFITRWKHQFSSRWIHTGIPFIQDISAGYDSHIVFPGSVIYGNNDAWRTANGEIVYKLLSEGITFNTWNGYTEGYAGMPTSEFGTGTYLWINDLFNNYEPDSSMHNIPGKIEAEDWAEMSGVQIDVALDDFEGLYVGWIHENDRIDYNVNILNEGIYYLDLRIAKLTDNPPGEAQIRVDDIVIKTVSIPGTGDWQNWETVKTTLSLPQGIHKLSIYITGADWNINWINFTSDSVEKYHEIPGRIEAEEYFDMFGVISEKTTDANSEVGLAYLNDGDWMEYYVDVQQDDMYDISFRVSQDAGLSDAEGKLYSGDSLLCSFIVPDTYGWQNWVTINDSAFLYKGKQKLRIEVTKAPWNINWFEFGLPTSLKTYSNDEPELSIYSDPAREMLTIIYTVKQDSKVKIELYDASGRKIEALFAGNVRAGRNEFNCSSGNIAGGIYYIRLQAKENAVIRKCIIIK